MKTSYVLSALIILILLGTIVYVANTSQPQPEVDNTKSTTTASTTATVYTSTSTPQTGSINAENPNVRNYANATLGLYFTYPKDFVIRREGFSSTTGEWSADFYGDRGDIVVNVGKNTRTSNVRLQSTAGKIGSKDANTYNTRIDNCDVAVASTKLDSENSLEFAFISCGDAGGDPIYKNRTDIDTTIHSVQYTNEGSTLYVNPKLGFAFRYPNDWQKPSTTSTSRATQITFGNELTLVSGGQYSAALRRNLTIDEVVTGAMTTGSTSAQKMTVGGKPATLLTTTPRSGATQRAIYMQNKSATDIILIKQIGVDSTGLDLVAGSFGFIK